MTTGINAVDKLTSLVKQKVPEEVVHRHLERHPWLIVGGSYLDPKVVLSKLPLGADHAPDFAFFNAHSGGQFIQLVEIEAPDLEVFTKGDDFTSRFNHAVQQLSDWEDWCMRHQDGVKLLMEPLCEQGLITKMPSFMRAQTLLIAGRRANVLANGQRRKRWEHKVNEGNHRVIRTWDGFIQSLSEVLIAETSRLADVRCVRYRKQGYVEVVARKVDD